MYYSRSIAEWNFDDADWLNPIQNQNLVSSAKFRTVWLEERLKL